MRRRLLGRASSATAIAGGVGYFGLTGIHRGLSTNSLVGQGASTSQRTRQQAAAAGAGS